MQTIQANMIIEILGKPKDNVLAAITSIVEKLEAEKGVKVKKKTIHEPVEVKDSKGLFTTFAEMEAEFDSVSTYLLISFAYLPSNMEIVHPEKITLTNHELGYLGNKIIQRVHEYDAVVKNIMMERTILLKKLQETAPHLFLKPEQALAGHQPQAVVVNKQEKQKKEKKKSSTRKVRK